MDIFPHSHVRAPPPAFVKGFIELATHMYPSLGNWSPLKALRFLRDLELSCQPDLTLHCCPNSLNSPDSTVTCTKRKQTSQGCQEDEVENWEVGHYLRLVHDFFPKHQTEPSLCRPLTLTRQWTGGTLNLRQEGPRPGSSIICISQGWGLILVRAPTRINQWMHESVEQQISACLSKSNLKKKTIRHTLLSSQYA